MRKVPVAFHKAPRARGCPPNLTAGHLLTTAVRFFLLQNRQGKTRLSKWYVNIDESDKRKIENEVHRLVTSRDNKLTNFVEVRLRWGLGP